MVNTIASHKIKSVGINTVLQTRQKAYRNILKLRKKLKNKVKMSEILKWIHESRKY